MNPAEIDGLLRQTFADRKVTPSEKQAYTAWLAANAADEQALAFVRSRAFALARESAGEPGVLDWLEDVIRATAGSRDTGPAPPPDSNAYFSPGDACIREVIRQFGLARQACHVCVFTITDDRITSAIEQAHRRGVAVRIITDDDKSHDLGSDLGRIKDSGVRCVIDRSPAHMHHKFAVFDDACLMTGSFNWTRSATECNEENFIVTADPRLVEAFCRRFEALWNRLTA